MKRPALILAWTVPLTFGVLAVGAVVRGEPLSGEAWGAIAAILGAVVAGTYSVRNNNDKGGKDE
jgi:drug/metabolite transporter (DMT)-like permease